MNNKLNLTEMSLLYAFLFWAVTFLLYEQSYQFLFLIIVSYLSYRIICLGKLKALIIVFVGLCYLFIQSYNYQQILKEPELEKTIKIRGEILPDTYKKSEGGISFILLSKTKKYKCYLKNNQEIKTNSLVEIKGNYSNGDRKRNPGAFDERLYNLQNGIQGKIIVTKVQSIPLRAQSVNYKISKFRKNLIEKHQRIYPKKVADYLNALVLGYKSESFDDQIKIYQKLGIGHLFSLSGLHINCFCLLLSYLLLRVGVLRSSLKYFLTPFLVFYYYLSGQNLSTWRSSGAYLLKEWLPYLDYYTVFTLLVCFQIFISPLKMLSIGAILSFLLSLIFLANSKEKKLFLSCLVFIISIPIILYFNGILNIAQIIWNFVSIPLFTYLILPMLLLIVIWEVVIPISCPLINPLNIFLSMLDFLSIKLEKLPYQVLTLGTPSVFCLGLYFLLLLYFFYLKKYHKITLSVIIKLVLVFSFSLVGSHFLSPIDEVSLIDVNQGDSIFIQKAFGRGTYLIDTGGKVGYGKMIKPDANKHLLPFLKSKGITNLDIVFLTHADQDHIGNFLELIKEVNVKKLVYPKGCEKKIEFQKLLKRTKDIRPNLKLCPILAPKKIADFEVLWPLEIGEGRNQDSLVMVSKIGKEKWLFTGDLESEQEKELLNYYSTLKIDILKVGHHGSKTSTSEVFLEKIKPKIALISSGRKNRFGHPNKEVIDRLVMKHIKILNTKEHGCITYKFNEILDLEELEMKIGE